MRDLDDPENPYAGMYADIDLWVRENKFVPRNPTVATQLAGLVGRYPVPVTFVASYVTDAGFLVPQAVYFEEQMLAYQGRLADPDQSIVNHDCPFRLDAQGELADPVLRSLRQQKLEVLAKYLPPVPQWLADRPPERAIILADGRVIAQGFLGAGRLYASSDPGFSRMSPGTPCTLYSAYGEVLQAGRPGGDWWELVFDPEQTVPESSRQAQIAAVEVNGCILYRDMSSEEIIASFNYDGTPLEPGVAPWREDGLLITVLEGSEMAKIHEIQQPGE